MPAQEADVARGQEHAVGGTAAFSNASVLGTMSQTDQSSTA